LPISASCRRTSAWMLRPYSRCVSQRIFCGCQTLDSLRFPFIA
jgi:hypothetical protein